VKNWLILRCPQCSRIMAIERMPHDPPTATLMEVRCAQCNAGDFDSASYFDVRGREVTWEAYGGEFLAKVGR
jgi:hypothetical protein